MTTVQMRRAGLVLVVLMLIVFGTETTLARLRRRDLTIALSVQHVSAVVSASGAAATAQPTAPATEQPDVSKTPAPATLTLTPTDQLLVTVTWDYSIGPRFYKTQIDAIAQIGDRIVATGQIKIDCGQAVLNCAGSQVINLSYTVPDTGSGVQHVPWPIGSYELVIDRGDGGLKPLPIQTTSFKVE